MARLTAAYGAAALVLVGISRWLAGGGRLSASSLTSIAFVVVAAYPLVLAFAWWRTTRAPAAKAAADTRTERRLSARGVGLVAAGVGALVAAAWVGMRPLPEATKSDPGAAPPAPLVAVLPLLDLDRRGDRTLADGVTELFVDGLAAVDGLEVRGRVSAESFIDVNRDAADIGAVLGAAVVLDGTIRRAPGDLRLVVRLVDVASGESLWTVSADTTEAGLFVIRDRVVRGVAGALGLGVGDRVLRRLERRRTNPAALDLWMLGRFRWAAGARGDLAEAASFYHQAIGADSGYAAAWTALADAYATLPRFTRYPPAGAREYGAAAARTALQLDAEGAGAHTALGEILFVYEHDWAGGRSHLERAAELDPGDAAPRDRLCELDLALAHLEAARAECAEARRRDPLAYRPAWLAAGLARASGDLPASLRSLDSLAAAYPDFEPLAGERAITRLLVVRSNPEPESSRAAVEADLAGWFELLADPPVADSLASTLATAAVGTGSAGSARRALEEVAANLAPAPAQLVALYARFGQLDRAAELALQALADRRPGALGFGVQPEYASLRARADVAQALAAAGLPAS
jgi:TolB-like protein